jgi:hypothetical protein
MYQVQKCAQALNSKYISLQILRYKPNVIASSASSEEHDDAYVTNDGHTEE